MSLHTSSMVCVKKNHSLLPSTITRILLCCRHNVSPSTAPSYVYDSNPGSLAPESGILPPSHGASLGMSPHSLCIYYIVAVDDCTSDPCLHGGSCTIEANGYSCSCARGYTSDNCQTSDHIYFFRFY